MMQFDSYRPIFRQLVVSDTVYAIVDDNQAKQRAQYFLSKARTEQHSLTHYVTDNRINYYLRIATDYGNAEAPFILAHRILHNKKQTEYSHDDVIIFLHIAAQRGHTQAAYQMAACYEGKDFYPEIMQAGSEFFSALKANERQLLARYYYEVAITR